MLTATLYATFYFEVYRKAVLLVQKYDCEAYFSILLLILFSTMKSYIMLYELLSRQTFTAKRF